jgi:ArsR family transcriptional regulator
MTDLDHLQAELARLTATVADLMARMAHLEEQIDVGFVGRHAPQPADLRAERHAGAPVTEEDAVQGTISYRGTVRVGADALDREISHPVATLMALEGTALAGILNVIASPTRLAILRALLSGPREARQLRDAVGPAHAGQVEHDLYELLTAGLVSQPTPAHFEVAPGRVIPLLTTLAAAHDLEDPHGRF